MRPLDGGCLLPRPELRAIPEEPDDHGAYFVPARSSVRSRWTRSANNSGRGEAMTWDWAGTLGTAIVGVAGIAATYLSASKARIAQGTNLQLAINAENDRARLTEKRHIYAAYMGATGSYVAAERRLAAGQEKDFGNERI